MRRSADRGRDFGAQGAHVSGALDDGHTLPRLGLVLDRRGRVVEAVGVFERADAIQRRFMRTVTGSAATIGSGGLIFCSGLAVQAKPGGLPLKT
jgi:hypothetical protein